jgi:hypothetical protein
VLHAAASMAAIPTSYTQPLYAAASMAAIPRPQTCVLHAAASMAAIPTSYTQPLYAAASINDIFGAIFLVIKALRDRVTGGHVMAGTLTTAIALLLGHINVVRDEFPLVVQPRWPLCFLSQRHAAGHLAHVREVEGRFHLEVLSGLVTS